MTIVGFASPSVALLDDFICFLSVRVLILASDVLLGVAKFTLVERAVLIVFVSTWAFSQILGDIGYFMTIVISALAQPYGTRRRRHTRNGGLR